MGERMADGTMTTPRTPERTAVLSAVLAPASAFAVFAALAATALVLPASLRAQTLVGRVLDEVTEAPVPAARVVLLDEGGKRVLEVESDSVGRFRLRTPRPGAFSLAASRLGYEAGETPLLDLSFDGTRALDLTLRPLPIGLPGLDVTVSAEEWLERELRMFGVVPGQLPRSRTVTTEEIEAVAAARDFGDVLQWQNIAGLRVFRSSFPDLVECVRVRVRAGCAVIVIDGAVAPMARAAMLPADAFEAMVVLMPHEAALLFGTQESGGGAVLLFSRGRGRR